MLLLGRPVLGRLDKGLDEEVVLGNPHGDKENAFRHPLFLEQGVLRTLPYKLLEPSVALHQILEDRHGLVVTAA